MLKRSFNVDKTGSILSTQHWNDLSMLKIQCWVSNSLCKSALKGAESGYLCKGNSGIQKVRPYYRITLSTQFPTKRVNILLFFRVRNFVWKWRTSTWPGSLSTQRSRWEKTLIWFVFVDQIFINQRPPRLTKTAQGTVTKQFSTRVS